jgi:hypothetical protein
MVFNLHVDISRVGNRRSMVLDLSSGEQQNTDYAIKMWNFSGFRDPNINGEKSPDLGTRCIELCAV